MELNILDAAVKLAALGASGVCVFAILWTGWLMKSLPAGADSTTHRTIRNFMLMCAIMALITGATGIANAKFNKDVIQALHDDNRTLRDENDTLQATKGEMEVQEAEYQKALEAMEEMLKIKAVASASSRDQTLGQSIKSLEGMIKRLKNP